MCTFTYNRVHFAKVLYFVIFFIMLDVTSIILLVFLLTLYIPINLE